MKKVPAHSLMNLPFPDCAGRCALEYLGVGECESACPGKFTKKGEPLTPDEWKKERQRRKEIKLRKEKSSE